MHARIFGADHEQVQMNNWSERATSEVIDLLRSEGLEIDRSEVIADTNRLVLKLEPSGLIVKIAAPEVAERMNRELAVATHVAASGGPAAPPAPPCTARVSASAVFSLWAPVAHSGEPSAASVCAAYAALRASLDSYPNELPDFRQTLIETSRVAHQDSLPSLATDETQRLRSAFVSGLSSLSHFSWTPRALHGDPHAGNVVVSRAGPIWLDFESACSGPLEWDLSALSGCTELTHDPDLLRVLIQLRRACVVTWCAARPQRSPAELEAMRHHISELEL